MAVAGKRLFWISIIIVELVAVYLLWRPYRDRYKATPHRAAVAPAITPTPRATMPPSGPSAEARLWPPPAARRSVAKTPESKAGATVAAHQKPPAALHAKPGARRPSVVVNAGLKTPEPIATTKTQAALTSPTTEGGMDSLASFWCRISMVEPKCDCQRPGDERANSQPLMPGEVSH